MADTTEPVPADEATTPIAEAPAAPAVPPAAQTAAPAPRRTVTLPVLPLAIVGAVVVALLFFGGGIAIGWGIGSHDGRGTVQPFRDGTRGDSGYGFGQGSGNGFGFGNGDGSSDGSGQNGRQNGNGQNGNGQRPGNGATNAPSAP